MLAHGNAQKGSSPGDAGDLSGFLKALSLGGESERPAGSESLGTLFAEAQALYEELDGSSSAPGSPEFQATLARAIAGLLKASALIEDLHVFSRNESYRELSSASLRIRILECSQLYFKTFFSDLDAYELLSPGDKAHLAQIVTKGAPRRDPGAARQAKIERFKRAKANRVRLADLTAALASGKTAGESQDDEDHDGDEALVLAMIESWVLKGTDDLEALLQELDLLEKTVRDRSPARSTVSSHLDTSTRLDVARGAGLSRDGPLMGTDGKILRPFVITSKRKDFQDGVFRPHWNLPTMTIDEYLDREEERGNILRGGGERPPIPIIEDSDAAQDADTYKKREWDEFAEANPKGAGNRAGKS